jgi:hypothetical protein
VLVPVLVVPNPTGLFQRETKRQPGPTMRWMLVYMRVAYLMPGTGMAVLADSPYVRTGGSQAGKLLFFS